MIRFGKRLVGDPGQHRQRAPGHGALHRLSAAAQDRAEHGADSAGLHGVLRGVAQGTLGHLEETAEHIAAGAATPALTAGHPAEICLKILQRVPHPAGAGLRHVVLNEATE